MLSPDAQKIRMSAIRDQILAADKEHEEESHGGKPCWSNRASTVAYIAHCLGIKPGSDVWERAGELLYVYEDLCDGC
jgi:hypothetical protein